MNRDSAHVKDILSMIDEIENAVRGLEYEEFVANRTAYRAVERNFEIIGEAVKRPSGEFTTKHPEIPWLDMAGFRDVLIHEYAAVNVTTVWDTLQEDIPKLKAVLKSALEKE